MANQKAQFVVTNQAFAISLTALFSHCHTCISRSGDFFMDDNNDCFTLCVYVLTCEAMIAARRVCLFTNQYIDMRMNTLKSIAVETTLYESFLAD